MNEDYSTRIDMARVDELATRRGFKSVNALAAACGVSEGAIRALRRRDGADAKLDTALRLANVLRCSVHWLTGRERPDIDLVMFTAAVRGVVEVMQDLRAADPSLPEIAAWDAPEQPDAYVQAAAPLLDVIFATFEGWPDEQLEEVLAAHFGTGEES